MFRTTSDSTTTTINSPTPLSPFSNESVPSEPTSDEQPNLGAFTTVFREWNYLQPPRRPVAARQQQQSSTSTTSHSSFITPSDHSLSELESDAELRPDGSTVWAQKPIASYLKLGDTETETDQDDDYQRRGAPEASEESDDDEEEYDSSDTEADRQSRTVYIADGSDEIEVQSSRGTEAVDLDVIHDDRPGYIVPTLGFQEALSFLANERERLSAQRSPGTYNGRLMSLAAASVEPRRKRRRRRMKGVRSKSIGPAEQDDDETSSFNEDRSHSSQSANHYTLSSGAEIFIKSTPGTPPPRRRHLRSSKSTPQLRPPGEDVLPQSRLFLTAEDGLRAKQMKGLAKKLIQLFPEDRKSLKRIKFGTLDVAEPPTYVRDTVPEVLLGDFVDTRGPPSQQANERIIHVFVDHSNILIGLLNYLKRYPHKHPQYSESQKLRHLSHSALTLILERGRPVTRRIIVASSPLYQPMASAEQLGYEVRIFARVPDMGDGMDRTPRPGMGYKHARSHSGSSTMNGANDGSGAGIQRRRSGSINNGNSNNSNAPPSGYGRRRGHSRKVSGSTSAESEQAVGMAAPGAVSFSQAFLKSLGSGSANASALSTSPPAASIPSQSSTPPARIRYREQGVDELLQLKLHQAIASIDEPPPPGSTIVLATGDGNVGQFNEDGFLGSVRTALKRGWNVELYAWEGGLSKSWKREFGEGSEWAASEKTQRFKIIGIEQFGADLVEIY